MRGRRTATSYRRTSEIRRRRLREAWQRDPALFRLRLFLVVVLVVLLGIVLSGNPAEGVPERLAEGKTPRGIDYWRSHGWWAALANAGSPPLLG